MLLRTTSKATSDAGGTRRWNVRRMLLAGLGALCGLLLYAAAIATTTAAQTQHSITIAVPSYTQAADAATGFNFYRGTTSGGPYTKLNAAPVPLSTTPPAAQFVDTTGVGGTTYFYVVTAVDANGNESANSNEVGATFLSNPAAPSGITATVK